MSRRPPRHHQQQRERSSEERLVGKVVRATNREQIVGCFKNEDHGEQEENRSYTVEKVNELPTSESYDIIRYDEKPGSVTEPTYFYEVYPQESNHNPPPTSNLFEKYGGGKQVVVQRSKSVPPSIEVKSRQVSSLSYDELLENTVDNRGIGENEIVDDYIRQNTIAERQSRQHFNYDDDVQLVHSRGRSPSKKVSYAQKEPVSDKGFVSPKKQCSPIQLRFRADSVETDSDMSVTVVTPPLRRPSRSQSASGTNRYYYQSTPPPPQPPPGPPMETNSDRSFVSNFDGSSVEDFININSGYRASNRYSQDSIPGVVGASSSVYGKDVLPLPIEIPDTVQDIEAFRRYLSVRRGAITPVRHQNISFEKRNQTSASYESIGRGPRRKTMSLIPHGQLGQEAGRRTSSLSHAIMTLALLSASICQLRFLITYSHAHAYPILSYFLVFTSIILEVAAGVGYVLIARCSYDDAQSETIHSYLIFALFIVAVSNVVLAAFAFDDHLCDEVKKLSGHTSPSPNTLQDQQFNQGRGERELDLRYMPLE